MVMRPAGTGSGSASLKRSLSLPMITLYGLGNILGAGIYVLIGKVAGHAGLFAPLSFVIASVLAGLTAFSYAELSARFPLSAGEAVYVQQGLGVRWLAAVVGLLIIFSGCVSSATILRGFVGYLQVFLAAHEAIVLPLVVLVLGGLAAWGITQSVAIAALFTLVEIFGLLMIIGVGAPELDELRSLPLDPGELVQLDTWIGIAVGAFLAFYAFIGFEDMVNVAEEVRRPERTMPVAILLTLAVSTLLYIAVALVALASLPPGELAGSDAPLAAIYQTLTGREPLLITVIGMFAVINGALIQMIMASRVIYGMADRGWLPRWLGLIHPATRTPVVATVLVAGMVLVLALSGTTEQLAKATSYALLAVFGLANLSLWRIKRTRAHPAGIIRIPQIVPVMGFIASLAVILIQLAIDLRP
jgi:amino acid transporter